MQYDFRSVYTSLLMDWFNTSQADIETVLFKDFQRIPFLKELYNSTDTKKYPASH